MFGCFYLSKEGKSTVTILRACRQAFPRHYVRLMAFDSTRGVESVAMSFLVQRPPAEPGFGLERQEIDGRRLRYTTRGYAAGRPEQERY